jgi:hypothetical protein
MTFIGLLGYLGILFLLLAYFLLLIGQLKVVDMHYIMFNMVGAFFVVLALYSGSSIPVFQTLVAWLFISVYGFYKHHVTTTT